MSLLFTIEPSLKLDEAIALYIASGIKRPTEQPVAGMGGTDLF